MKGAALLAILGGLGAWLALGGTASASEQKNPPKTGPALVPPPTGKSIPQRMAEVLATNDPNAIRFEAARFKAEGYVKEALELEKAAAELEAEIAAGKRPAPSYPVPVAPPVVVPGVKPPLTPPAPPVVITTQPPVIPGMPPISVPSIVPPLVPPSVVAPPVMPGFALPKGVLLRNGKNMKPPYPAPGSSGPLVTALQLKLISLGFPVGSKGADGKFGDDTERAVRAFQNAANIDALARGIAQIKVDGIVGPQTAAKLASASTSPVRMQGDIHDDRETFSGDVFAAPSSPQPASPLPGVVPLMAPSGVDPRRALASALAAMLFLCSAQGKEDRELVRQFQAQEGLKASGYYGPSAAVRLATAYGIVPPKPLYWPTTGTKKSKSNYKAQLRALESNDPQRAEEWRRAATV